MFSKLPKQDRGLIEDIPDLIGSKVKDLFDGEEIEYTKELQKVIKSFQINETREGELDERRTSTEVIRRSDTLPVSTGDGSSPRSSIKGPIALAHEEPHNKEKWRRETKDDQNEIFRLLSSHNEFLDKTDSEVYIPICNGLTRDDICSDEEFCNALDKLAILFAKKEPTSTDPDRRLTMDKIHNLCQKITLRRIYLASVNPKDVRITEKPGIASFAAVMVGLEIYLRNNNQTWT